MGLQYDAIFDITTVSILARSCEFCFARSRNMKLKIKKKLKAMQNTWDANSLDQFVERCDAEGGIWSPQGRETTKNFKFKLKTKVNVSLDPFSEEYFQQQLAVYTEISGRELDQESGEMFHVDVASRVSAQNPYGVNDIAFISKHSRTVLTALMIANPSPNARILDMGAGWGLSSEMMAFAGAKVTAVDINPDFVELINERSARLDLPIVALQGNFETVEPGDDFDLVLFYECLHHAVRPMEILKRVSGFLGPTGRIVLAGEPVNTIWWPHWGMRLDAESVYVMRKFGWFESGWSQDFICKCFRLAGFEPTWIPRLGIDGGDICVADRNGAKGMRPLAIPPEPLAHTKRHPWKHLKDALLMRRK